MLHRGGGAQAGLFQGLQVGEVVENVDPEEYGRIKVKLYTVHNEPVTKWVWQLTTMAGKERGFYTLPEIGDEVLVGFIGDSQDNAVILGGLWNGKDKPPPEAKDGLPGPAKTDTGATWSTDQFTDGSKSIDGNDRRFWKSRSGHLIVFDDTNGAETVQIWDKDHNLSITLDSKEKRIIIANTQGDVHIRAKENIFLETTNGDVKIRAGRDLVSESVQNTTQTTGQNWSVEAKQSTSLTSNMSTTVTGKTGTTVTSEATTKVEGKAMTEVSGGAVKVGAQSAAQVQAPIIKLN